MSILVDTGAWYALADSSDRHHAGARAFFAERAGTVNFLTTDLVLAETWALLRAHLGRPAALTFWSGLRETRTPIVAPDPSDLEAAWRIAQAFPDQAFSVVDCTTFAMMERLGVDEAFAFDAQFLIYRFGPNRERAFRRLPL
ncbi:MAG: type II toxin-antitoxin system VapC family toxin [Armatimonadota bacterium]